ncbi:hypothetical protein DSO57_1034337 [Entomophthora muscae]|uniref:Uncharacterized protein n=1 Tax=Entomophthora muscae TaxID=34485 RepID=A0ACC2SDA8_9FUNG|nr:hypothetical protein DSO57_1034337 [Entomophthora muscae]
MIIYTSKSHHKALKDQEVWPSDATFASFPKIFDQLWALHAKVEERVVPLIYFLVIETKQENYLDALKIITKEIQKMVLEEQETRPTPAGRPPKDPAASIRLKNPDLVPLDFEAVQSIEFREVFGSVTQGCYFYSCQACLGKMKTFKDLYKKYTSDT